MSDFKKLIGTIDLLNDLPNRLKIPSDDREIKLSAWLDLREKFLVNDRVKHHLQEAASQWASRFAGESRKGQLLDFANELLSHIDAQMTQRWKTGEKDPRIIFAGDFDLPLRQIPLSLANGTDDMLFAGVVESYTGPELPKPPCGWFKVGTAECVVLGLAETLVTGLKVPRNCYRQEDAQRLTIAYRTRQIAEEQEEEFKQRIQKEQELRNFEASELGRHIIRQKTIERLKRAGKIPPELLETGT